MTKLCFDAEVIPSRGNGIILRKLMCDRLREHLVLLTNVNISLSINKLYNLGLTLTEDIDKVQAIEHLFNNGPSIIKYDHSSNQRIICTNNIVIGMKNARTKLVTSDGKDIDNIPQGSHVANVLLRFTKCESSRSGHSLRIIINRIDFVSVIQPVDTVSVIQSDGIVNHHVDLPSISAFRKMTMFERLKYYRNTTLCSSIDNAMLDYCLVKKGNDFVISKSQDIPKESIVSFNGNISVCKLDIRNTKSFHYCIILGHTDKRYQQIANKTISKVDSIIMDKARNYVVRRGLDVRGMWYDQTDTGRPHINLHIASELPLEYFKMIFDAWSSNTGSVWLKPMHSPCAWRVYASRNHLMYKSTTVEYKSDFEALLRFHKYMLSVNAKFKENPDCNIDTLSKLMKYNIYFDEDDIPFEYIDYHLDRHVQLATHEYVLNVS